MSLKAQLLLAKADHDLDLLRVAHLEPDQQDYLARLREVEDPKSDGLACFDHEGHGSDEVAH